MQYYMGHVAHTGSHGVTSLALGQFTRMGHVARMGHVVRMGHLVRIIKLTLYSIRLTLTDKKPV